MLMDIFSSFDPAMHTIFKSLNSSLFWLLSMFSMLTISSSFWLAPSRISTMMFYPLSFMNSQTSRTTGGHLKGFSGIISSLFFLIILINLSGLAPYIFSLSSHLIFTLSFALPLWFALIMSSLTLNPSSFAAALLPGGAPDWLNPFLVIIETISTLVRPFTLSFRLAANMSAGHIVLTLIGVYTSSAFFTSSNMFILLILTQTGYILFEVAICLIQAYIFTLLLSLYSDDHVN